MSRLRIAYEYLVAWHGMVKSNGDGWRCKRSVRRPLRTYMQLRTCSFTGGRRPAAPSAAEGAQWLEIYIYVATIVPCKRGYRRAFQIELGFLGIYTYRYIDLIYTGTGMKESLPRDVVLFRFFLADGCHVDLCVELSSPFLPT